jgi:hypothetical protein
VNGHVIENVQEALARIVIFFFSQIAHPVQIPVSIWHCIIEEQWIKFGDLEGSLVVLGAQFHSWTVHATGDMTRLNTRTNASV